ncbi:aconitase family protein, partial [Microbacteriaceae bacterium K1510]|nr:aconitase family protein [Microbacteriaceae bacterium K1510]
MLMLEARDAATAHDLYAAHKPDVAVIDINLPDVSGFELARRLQVRDPHARIIMFSMNDDPMFAAQAIEGGARAGMIAPDEKTYEFIKGRPKAPKGGAWDSALRYWETLNTEEGAHFDSVIRLDAAKLPPIVTWGTSPEDVVSIAGAVPDPSKVDNENKRASMQRALDYMG